MCACGCVCVCVCVCVCELNININILGFTWKTFLFFRSNEIFNYETIYVKC